MDKLFCVYCRNCGEDVGIATVNRNSLEEMNYNCRTCGDFERKASEGLIKVIDKDKWQTSIKYYDG